MADRKAVAFDGLLAARWPRVAPGVWRRLELAALRDGEAATVPAPFDWCTDYRRDGTRVPRGEPIRRGAIARDWRFRAGVGLLVSTAFVASPHVPTELLGGVGFVDLAEVPGAMLWETYVFAARPARRPVERVPVGGPWRYATEAAALAGHRRILAELRTERLHRVARDRGRRVG